jgi:hypothetical protein
LWLYGGPTQVGKRTAGHADMYTGWSGLCACGVQGHVKPIQIITGENLLIAAGPGDGGKVRTGGLGRLRASGVVHAVIQDDMSQVDIAIVVGHASLPDGLNKRENQDRIEQKILANIEIAVANHIPN